MGDANTLLHLGHLLLQGLKALLTTLIISLPAFYNVGALLMLVFFMYSYVAVLLFGSIQAQDAITSHANFSNFGKLAKLFCTLQCPWMLHSDKVCSNPACHAETACNDWLHATCFCLISTYAPGST